MSSHHLLDDDPELVPRRDREVTLSTGSILAIFFGLVLLCGLFFALGYNMHKSSPPIAAAGDDSSAGESSSSSSTFSHFKPSAGSPNGSSAPAATASTAASTVGAPPPPTPTPAAAAASTPAPATTASTETAAPAPAPAHATPVPVAPIRTGAEPPAAPATVAPGPGTFMVQIAAVSHQEDATLLVGALKSKGYAVSARTEPQDKLFHIQVGPFATKKDADTMRQRLLADGYNAIVK